jgi:ribosomal protein S18 acetylase RimI-like enzyme
MEIQRVTEVDDSLVRAIQRLVPQLNPTVPPPTREHLEALVASGSARLLVARDSADGGEIVGMLTVAWYPLPTGVRVWIEDVVVDDAARGRGVGEALVRGGLDEARTLGASRVELTSRPEREAANRLYPRVGFEKRATNAYRYHLGG